MPTAGKTVEMTSKGVKKLTKKQQEVLEKKRGLELRKNETRGFNEKLIAAVGARNFLYDKQDPNHGRKHRISNAWVEIADEVGSTVSACHTRWRSLRDTFVKKYQETVNTGSGDSGDETENIAWPWYTSLMFLKNSASSQRTIDSFNPEEECAFSTGNSTEADTGDSACEVIKDNNAPSRKVSSSKRRKEAIDDVIDKLSKLIDSQTEETRAPTTLDAFLRYVQAEVQSFCTEDEEEFVDGCTQLLLGIKKRRRERRIERVGPNEMSIILHFNTEYRKH